MDTLTPATASPTLGDYKSFLTPQQEDQQPPDRFYLDHTSPSGLSEAPPETLTAKKDTSLWGGIMGVFHVPPEELAHNKELRDNLLQAIQAQYPQATNLMQKEMTSLSDLKGPKALHMIHQAEGIHTAVTGITTSLARIKEMTEQSLRFPTFQKFADDMEKDATTLAFPTEPHKDPAVTLDKKLRSLQKLQIRAGCLLELREELANDLKSSTPSFPVPLITDHFK